MIQERKRKFNKMDTNLTQTLGNIGRKQKRKKKRQDSKFDKALKPIVCY